jgi:transcriptional regulator with XRE-family HTH domain
MNFSFRDSSSLQVRDLNQEPDHTVPQKSDDCRISPGAGLASELSPTNCIGTQLRTIRSRLRFTLRETEERSAQIAQQWGNESYRISASWLDRVERENRGLSATKLIVLAYIYNLSPDQILALCPGARDGSQSLLQASSPNSTLLLTEGPLDRLAKHWLPGSLTSECPPDETMLLQTDPRILPNHYRRGIIGCRDRTLEPMVLPGSIVLIDTLRRAIANRKAWTNEFDRPIYFLFTHEGYYCGFCDLDKRGEFLSLVPHMLSPEPNDEKRWRYRREVEVIGTVVGLFTKRLG